jgi:hypothetical protein
LYILAEFGITVGDTKELKMDGYDDIYVLTVGCWWLFFYYIILHYIIIIIILLVIVLVFIYYYSVLLFFYTYINIYNIIYLSIIIWWCGVIVPSFPGTQLRLSEGVRCSYVYSTFVVVKIIQ